MTRDKSSRNSLSGGKIPRERPLISWLPPKDAANKFENADECEHHFDTGNVGPSRIIMFGDFVGGALVLDDGRVFSEKRVWHEYDGAKVGHEVAPFEGERMSIVAYRPKT